MYLNLHCQCISVVKKIINTVPNIGIKNRDEFYFIRKYYETRKIIKLLLNE